MSTYSPGHISDYNDIIKGNVEGHKPPDTNARKI